MDNTEKINNSETNTRSVIADALPDEKIIVTSNTKIRNKFIFPKIKKLRLILIMIILLTAYLSYVNRNEISKLLAKTGLWQVMRSIGLIKPNVPGYFAALESQNLVYDYNDDGKVTGEDYSLLVGDIESGTRVGESTVTSSNETSAVSENLSLPSIKGISTDAFTGSATTSYPIELPSAPSGLVPSLTLSYSSGSVDDLYTGIETKWRNDATHPYQKQAGIVGLGWNLSSGGSIYRDTQGTLNDPSDDTFALSFGGGTANLVKESDDGSYSLWRTAPNLKSKVERWSRCKTHTYNNGDTNVSFDICRYHWKVTTPDGTKYYFGLPQTSLSWNVSDDPDASYFYANPGDWYPLYSGSNVYPPWIVYGSNLKGWHALVTEWKLTKTESVFHVEGSRDVDIEYSYQFEAGDYNGKKYVTATYPYKILYGKNEVEFIREPRWDKYIHQGENPTPEQPFVSSDRIKKILVKSLNKTIRAYVLEYKYGYDATKHPDTNGNGILDQSEVVRGQVIHSLLQKITPWSGDPG